MKTKIEKTKSIITNQDENINGMFKNTSFNIGMVLEGKYEIKREISRGGMGIVYEAYDNFTNRQVAIKVILGNKIDTLQLKRFQKEIEACARLSHPNVIKIYDAGTYENNPYIVMEYIDGVDICEYVAQQDKAYGQQSDPQEEENAEKKERDWKLCAKLIYETALGLEYIHKQKMFHRDIKPSNIMVRSNGTPIIIDMGLVKFNKERSYNLTRSRDIIGTCQYMPIEQAQGKRGEIDARSDVYSLGLVLYELLTEQQAYTGKNMTEVFNKIASYYPPLPREINPQIPEVLEEITIHATEKQKERRYATAQEFADALKQYLDGTTTQTTTQYAHYKKRLWLQRNKNKIIACCIAVLLVAGIVGIAGTKKTKNNIAEINKEKINMQNDAETQYQLGLIYERGTGVQQDYKKAIEYYEKAANQEHVEARNKLALFYYNGQFVEQSYKKAFELLEKGKKQKNVEAQYILGLFYYNGKEIEQDYEQAFKWFKKAAKQEHAEAQNILGFLYGHGKGVKKNLQEAFTWYKKAAKQENTQAQYNLGVLYENGKGVKKSLKKAFEWYEKAANKGHAEAQNMLGVLYENGKGVPQDMKKAWEWYQRAANQGYIDAQYNIATLYLEGKGVNQNINQAMSWYQKVANQGYAEAQYRLGLIYEKDIPEYQDMKKAIYWYEKASNNGHADAQDRLGLIYYKDKNYKDYDKAKELFEKAAAQDQSNSMYCLGIMYNFGYGVPQDYTKAFYYFDKTAPRLSWSKYYLAELYYNGYGVEWDYEKAKDLYQKSMKKEYHLAEVKLIKLENQEKQLLRRKNSIKTVMENIKPDNRTAIISLQQLAFLNIPEAQYHLGVYYAQGIIFKKNIEKATILLTKAAQQGYKEAEEYLKNIKSSND